MKNYFLVWACADSDKAKNEELNDSGTSGPERVF